MLLRNNSQIFDFGEITVSNWPSLVVNFEILLGNRKHLHVVLCKFSFSLIIVMIITLFELRLHLSLRQLDFDHYFNFVN